MSREVMGLLLPLRAAQQIHKIVMDTLTLHLPVLCRHSRMDPAFYNSIGTSEVSKRVIPTTES